MDQAKQSALSEAVSVPEFLRASLAQACSREVGEVSLETNLLDLGMDSLTLISVLAQVEAVYGIELTADDTLGMMEATFVSDLVLRLERLMDREG